MGETTYEWSKLEQKLAQEEEEEMKSLSPELAKVIKILLRRSEKSLTPIQNDIIFEQDWTEVLPDQPGLQAAICNSNVLE